MEFTGQFDDFRHADGQRRREWGGVGHDNHFCGASFDRLKIIRQFVRALVNRDAPSAKFAQESGLEKASGLRRLPQRGHLGHKQPEGVSSTQWHVPREQPSTVRGKLRSSRCLVESRCPCCAREP